ncbi:MAG: potassium channel family protein [Pseudomonadota bacterium]
MLRQILLAGVVSACNIAIHALVMAAVFGVTKAATRRFASHRSGLLIAVMIATVAVLMAAHVLEVMVWAGAYAIFEVAPAGTDMYYFAFVNYTTLGYGDVIPVERWRLIGPMTAMNGVLLFGWSTAVIFHVLLRVLEKTRA